MRQWTPAQYVQHAGYRTLGYARYIGYKVSGPVVRLARRYRYAGTHRAVTA